MKHSVDLQALALHTGNVLVSKLWPILNRETITYPPVINFYGLYARDISPSLWVLPSCEPHKEMKIPAAFPRGRGRRFQMNKMLF